jgi:hypothetical protein
MAKGSNRGSKDILTMSNHEDIETALDRRTETEKGHRTAN